MRDTPDQTVDVELAVDTAILKERLGQSAKGYRAGTTDRDECVRQQIMALLKFLRGRVASADLEPLWDHYCRFLDSLDPAATRDTNEGFSRAALWAALQIAVKGLNQNIEDAARKILVRSKAAKNLSGRRGTSQLKRLIGLRAEINKRRGFREDSPEAIVVQLVEDLLLEAKQLRSSQRTRFLLAHRRHMIQQADRHYLRSA